VFSGIVFHKQLMQQREVQEMNLAQNLKGVQEAVRLYVNDNKSQLESGAIPTPRALTTADLSDYLQAGSNVDEFRIVVRNRGGKQPLQAVIISSDRLTKGGRLDEVSGARIAAMAGSSAGVIKSGGHATGTLGL
jgi:hypothetical protein